MRHVIALATALGISALTSSALAQTDVAKPPLLPLKAQGNKIVNTSGQEVRLTGVNCASLEWTSTGEGHMLQTVKVAIDDWKVNIIRLPLSQDRWFGQAGEQRDGGKAYRALVEDVVKLCESKNCYIILDLHWNDLGEWGALIGQHSMPDENSLAFWANFAPIYANRPAVIFDLYNEPHDITWDVWLKGGDVTDRPNTAQAGQGGTPHTYHAVGMQTLLNTVRATGAMNLVIAGGLDWAYDMTGFLKGYQLKDPKGNGVIYANHVYNNKGDSAWAWVDKMEAATAVVPVIISEFGGSSAPAAARGRGRAAPASAPAASAAATPPADNWLLHVLQAINDHKWSYTAWDLHTSAGPTLISDWNYTPTPNYGTLVKALLDNKYPTYTPPPRPPETPRRGRAAP